MMCVPPMPAADLHPRLPRTPTALAAVRAAAARAMTERVAAVQAAAVRAVARAERPVLWVAQEDELLIQASPGAVTP